MRLLRYSLLISALLTAVSPGFEDDIRPLLDRYCLQCHGGDKIKGKVDFSAIQTQASADGHADLWDTVADVLEHEEMPPEDEDQPTAAEREVILNWYKEHFGAPVEPLPGIFQPRRLSAAEYRNTLRSLFGFDLEVTVAAAEQTVTEKSLVMKLLPADPPGASGFVNDTHGAPLSTTLWDQYSYLADTAIEELFSKSRRRELATLTNSSSPADLPAGGITPDQAASLLRNFLPRAFRRPLSDERLSTHLDAIDGLSGNALIVATKGELKAALMSPPFLYRGLLMVKGDLDVQQPVDDYELAERLSYFLWEDMPDPELSALAASGKLTDPATFAAQVDRLLDSPKARSLSLSFANQWLSLDDIDDVSKDPTRQHAYKSQPHDFLHYLFTGDRPVIELIDSEVAFVNNLTAGYYNGKDRRQMVAFKKQKGIERTSPPNQKITLENTPERGGILTMPGVLAMNRGPILRGTWMLRRILGVELGEPPADVPPIKPSPRGKNLSFRERFEAHRSDASCARCHKKIDPLGFAMEAFDGQGKFIGNSSKKKIDTAGQLPTGESFETFSELQSILLTKKRRDIIRNAVERTLAYALCRKLERHDRPTVDAITDRLDSSNGTWRDLFLEVATSLPFRETVIASKKSSS